MNELIPFRFDHFQTQEATYDKCNIDWIKRYRFTRRAIGDFLYPGHKNPELPIRKIISRFPALKALAVAVTVTATEIYRWGHGRVKVTPQCPPEKVSQRTREYGVETYDIFGVYQIALKSNAPRKEAFLENFPTFLQALQQGKIKPILPPTEKMLIAMKSFQEIAETPHGHKVAARMKLQIDFGIPISTQYRWERQLNYSGALQYKYHEGAMSRVKNEQVPRWKLISQLLKDGKMPKEISTFLGVSLAQISRAKRRYFKHYGI